MSRTVLSALKSMLVLTCISVVCVGLLAVCNKFFPSYVPTLDGNTADLINTICPTGVDGDTAYNDGYIVMLYEDEYGVTLADYNKANKSKKAQILCVYGEVKGENTGAFVIECSSTGRDGDIVILTAYRGGAIVGATVKKQGESYWSKLPEDLFGEVIGSSGDVDLNGTVGKTGATISLTAIERAINLSNDFAAKYEQSIRGVISQKTEQAVIGSVEKCVMGAAND